MITAGLALAVAVACLGGTVALFGIGLGQLRQQRLDGMAKAARLAGGRMALAGLTLFTVTALIWLVMIALALIFGW